MCLKLWFVFTFAIVGLGCHADEPMDSLAENPAVSLDNVIVVGKEAKQQGRDGAFTTATLDIKHMVNKLASLNDLVDRTSGVKVRREGGMGSDYELSINGLSGNSIRYFIDGVPLDTKGTAVNLENLPLNTVSRVEIYKGVVPAYLGSDALGGAVNIVTKKTHSNYLDASIGGGSYGTLTGDIAAQIGIKGTQIVVRPSVSVKYSKNNYMMKGVEVWDPLESQYIYTNRRRFHDDFFSLIAQVEAGVDDVSWADAFFISGSYSKVNKEIQTGAMQNKVYGEAERHSSAWNLSARYAKRFGDLNTRLIVSHTWDNRETVDTAYRKYNWDGDYTPSSGNEITGRTKSWRLYKRPMTVVNANLDYQIDAHSNIALSYMLDRTGNDRRDKVDRTFTPSNDYVTKQILALNYTLRAWRNKWLSTAFVKDYINGMSINQTELASITGSDQIDRHSTKSYQGAGLGSRLHLWQELSIKGSYEHSVRLPQARELLGNGTTIYPNLALKPESSNNGNVGLYGTFSFGSDNALSYEVGGYIRHVQNYIRAAVSERDGLLQYENLPAVHIKGIEVELNYIWRDALAITVNGTIDDARDLKKYKTDGNPSATYNNRVPNRPWKYANAEVSYSFRNVANKHDHLRIGCNWQWVHWYYLSWEAYGYLASKAKIPTQSVWNADVTYSWHNNRYNLTIECNNIFDQTCYDNYMLQKPGRAIYAKIRVFLNKPRHEDEQIQPYI